MIPVVSLLLILVISLLITRIAAVALVHTGLGREAARFQARSAFTGVGFTTSESENVVGHPVRRRIVLWLMLAGNAGTVTAMSTLLLSLIDFAAGSGTWAALGVLAGGVLAIIALGSSQHVDRIASRAISWALKRWTNIDARDYARLLHLREDYGVSEMLVGPDDWIAGRTVSRTGLAEEGVLVLGMECPGGHFIGAPPPDTEIRAGDRLIIYGRTPRIAELDRRSAGGDGESSHAMAINEHRSISEKERSRAGRRGSAE